MVVTCPEPKKPHKLLQITFRGQQQEDTSFRDMCLLKANPDLTQSELAKEVKLIVGGFNFCLKALIDKGRFKMQNFSHSENEFGYVYTLNPTGMAVKAALTSRFLKHKMGE